MMRRVRNGALWAVLATATALAQPPLGYTIATIAGNGTSGFAGDSGPATDAQLNNPVSLALDSAGNLYIADHLNSRIRKITGTTISTVAGNGTRGYFGDTGQATSAGISYPQGVAVDGSGNIYIADSPNHGVRKVTSGGIITTVAGGSFAAYDGDGAAATSARINTPQGIAVDAAGNFYFSDAGNQRIRKVATDGKISTVAGNGSIGFLGDGGPALKAFLNNPTALALDAAGNLYICDTDNGMIRKMTTDGNITTIAGTGTNGYSGDGGPATRAMLNRPKGVAVDANGLVYIADTFNSRIRVVSANGTITTIAGNGYIGEAGDGGPAKFAILRFPAAVAVGSGGRVYVGDTQNSRVRVLTPIVATAPSAPPAITPGGVVSAGAFGGGPVAAPGSWIEIFGTNFSTATRDWTAAEFTGARGPTSLDGTRVTVGGQAAFVSFVSPAQVNVQIPSNVGTGPQPVVVTTATGVSAPVTITINNTRPGILAPPAFRAGARQYAAALLPDGRSYALPVASIRGTPTRPARPGEIVILFGIGFGTVSPSVLAGEVAQTTASVETPVQVLFGQTPAAVNYAGLVPGTVGLYQFNVVVPEVPDSENVALSVSSGGVAAAQQLFIAVRR